MINYNDIICQNNVNTGCNEDNSNGPQKNGDYETASRTRRMIMMIAMITISVDNENNGDNGIMIKKTLLIRINMRSMPHAKSIVKQQHQQ